MHYHAHFTVPGRGARVRGFKRTTIELEGGGREQTDVMLTRHYYRHDLVDEEVMACVRRDLEAIRESGQEVTRVKLERTGDIAGLELTEDRYYEAHIKTVSETADYARNLAVLRALGESMGFRLSRNARESSAVAVAHFANLRVRSGMSDEAARLTEEVVAAIEAAGIHVKSVHREINVWDSNAQTDRWWA